MEEWLRPESYVGDTREVKRSQPCLFENHAIPIVECQILRTDSVWVPW